MKLIESHISETYQYESIEEKIKHKKEMIDNNWDVDGENFGETISITYIKETL